MLLMVNRVRSAVTRLLAHAKSIDAACLVTNSNHNPNPNHNHIPTQFLSTGPSNESTERVTLSGNENKPRVKPTLKVIFEFEDGRQLTGLACDGDSLLDVVLNNQLELDGFGACEGTLACSTCHLILSDDDFNRLPNKITDEEMDMLDLAYGLTETSRLGCQIYMTKQLDGLKVKVPNSVNDVRLR